MSDLDLIRTHPQSIELQLSIYKPNVILACQVNSVSIAKGSRVIPYDTVSSGNYQKVVSGMTLWVGSAPGKWDLGKVRVKSASSLSIVVAENSHIKWADNLYLTIVDVVDINPIFQRIVQNPSNPEILYWYKDYNIPYTNQNALLGSFVCMGPHRAANLGDNGRTNIWYSATGTQNINGESLSYAWEFPGATGITGSNAETPGYIVYDTPGHYATKLTVTSPGGAVDYSYRYVSIYPRYQERMDWEIVDGNGSRGAGGYSANIKIHRAWNYDIYEGAIIVIYSDEWYGNTHACLGGNAINNNSIYFVGYISQGSIKWSYDRSTVEFQVVSVTEIMKNITGFAISVENSKLTPSTWYQIQKNSVKKSVYHYFRFHSTLLMTTDFQFLATDRNIQYFDSDRGSLYDGANSVLKSALMAELTCDLQGKLWVQTSMEATHLAKSAYSPQFTLGKDDWINEPAIQEVNYDVVSYVEMGGIVFTSSLSTENSVALLAAAPGVTPGVSGKVETPKGLALTSQTQLNQLVGDVFAYRNAKHPEIEMEMRGSYRLLDIAPLKVAQIVIASEDTSRNISINTPYFVENLKFRYDSKNQFLKTTITWREITEGIAGDTVIIPATSPENVPHTDYTIPSFPPIWTPPAIWVPTTPPLTAPKILAVIVSGIGLFYANLDSGFYHWENANTPFLEDEYPNFADLQLSRIGTAYLMTSNKVLSSLLGSNDRTLLGDDTFFKTYIPDSGPPYYLSYHLGSIGVNPNDDANLGVVAYRGYPSWITRTFKIVNNQLAPAGWPGIQFNRPGALSGYNGKWYMSVVEGVGETTRLNRFDETLVIHENALSINGPGSMQHIHARNADLIYTLDKQIRKISSLGSVIDATYTGAGNGVSEFSCDPTGQYIAKVGNATPISLKISNDYGATFVAINSLPAVRACTYCRVVNLGDGLSWAVSYVEATGAPGITIQNVYITIDGGSTWANAIGNLADIGMGVSGPITVLRAT